MFRHSWGFRVAAIAFWGAVAVQSATSQPQPSAISELLQKQINEHHLAGMIAVVVRAEGVAVIGPAGVKRTGQNATVSNTDLFHLGSNTKAFTATMIGRLVEAKKLTWTTTPLDVFPELKDSIHPALRSVTLEQLLSHHAGIPPYEDTDAKEYKALPKIEGTAVEQRRKFTAWVLQQKPTLDPGTKGSYSNAGFTISAAMAERVTGSTWEQLISSEVLEPLGIRAVFTWPVVVDQGQTWGHAETKASVRAVNQADSASALPLFLLPAGGMAMTAGDYAKFLQEHLKVLEGKESKFLTSETMQRLHTSLMKDKYALGWGVQPVGGILSYTHTGSAGSFYAAAALQPSVDVGVAVLVNSDGERSAAAAATALKALLLQYAASAR